MNFRVTITLFFISDRMFGAAIFQCFPVKSKPLSPPSSSQMSPYSCNDWLQTHLLQVTNGKCFIWKDATPPSITKVKNRPARIAYRGRCPISPKRRPAVHKRQEQDVSSGRKQKDRRDSFETCVIRLELKLERLRAQWSVPFSSKALKINKL